MKKIISKLLIGTIKEKELVKLQDWLNDPKNRSTLESYIRDQHDLNLATLKSNIDSAYDNVINRIDRNEKPVERLIPNWAKYAAAAILFFGIGFLFQQAFFLPQDEIRIAPKDQSIILKLDNGTVQTIDITQTKEVRDASGNILGTQKQNQISYSQTTEKEDLVFNTLTIPNGKRFELELSDGTLVYLNAGSSLRYPVKFLGEGPRQVFLSGEAYFEVSKNKSNPFVVRVNELDIKVLGTEFNVSAYNEDTNIDVVLVEGSVSLDNDDGLQDVITELSPGQMGSFDPTSKNISVALVNTEFYTSWMQGHLVFRDLTFNQIVTKLERHYSIEIENSNTELGQEIFNASFSKVEIEKVLSFFGDTHEIEYIIKNNTIIIE